MLYDILLGSNSFPTRRSSDLDVRPLLLLAEADRVLPLRRSQRHLAEGGVPHQRVGVRDRRLEEQGHRQRSEEHTSELQSPDHLVCRLLLEKKIYGIN